MKLEKLIKSEHIAGRFYAALENGESLKVDIGVIADMGLFAGRELSDDELTALRESSEGFEAKERALNMLAARQMSRRELTRKLREKGVSEAAAEAAADTMERIGAVNDAEYAASIVRHYSKKGYGVGRVKQELMRRGVDRELWEAALGELPDTDSLLDELIDRRLRGTAPDKKELKRLTDMLARRGFSWGEISAALRRFGERENYYEEID